MSQSRPRIPYTYADLRHPLISNNAEHLREDTLFEQHFAEASHERRISNRGKAERLGPLRETTGGHACAEHILK